jgi:hypothetical protein
MYMLFLVEFHLRLLPVITCYFRVFSRHFLVVSAEDVSDASIVGYEWFVSYAQVEYNGADSCKHHKARAELSWAGQRSWLHVPR